jgi:two-component system copper resistance phosphate regulon response regulator CusR
MCHPHILIVEDEPKVSAFIKKGLEVNDFHTSVAIDGQAGLNEALSGKFDAIILDLHLPLLSGMEVCRQIRQADTITPILMLTALGTVADKVSGFNLGADDYLVKPFEFEELMVRIKALLKRASPGHLSPTLIIADLEINSNTKMVKRAGKKIDLTAKEFMLLEYLVKNKGRVLSRADIAEKIWDITFDRGTNIIDLYIFYLRKKIDANFTPKLIHTQIGMGYIVKEEGN